MRVFIAILVAVSVVLGTTWRVPEDYPTIQQALDSLSDGDTILVAAGTYHESLQAPSRSFVWLGIVDSGGTPDRPVVDPSPLDNSDSLSCLRLPPGSHAVIENMIFRNGPEMYPHVQGTMAPGGILDRANDLTLRNCVFDSTYLGLEISLLEAATLQISDCQFLENQRCLQSRSGRPVTVMNSSFSGSDLMVWVTDSARIENCTFHDKPDGGAWVWLSGDGVVVRGCTFGPTIVPAHLIVFSAAQPRGCLFENNLFHDLDVLGSVIFFAGGSGDASVFHNNVFRNCRGVIAGSAGGGLEIDGQNGTMDMALTECTFDSCTTWSQYGIGAMDIAFAVGNMEDNLFVGHLASAPTVSLFGSPGVRIANSLFERTGLALRVAYMDQDTTNAEHNWWDDSTGPYHAQLNPGGQGDTIIGPVDFEPWLMDTVLAAPEVHNPLPATAQLEVSPNPFNATTVLQLTVREPGVYAVDLYNTLGQRVRRIWSGSVTGEKQILLNGEGLASGVYFARATLSSASRTAAQTKVVLLK